MLSTDSPPKFPLAFAQNAGGGFVRPIPTASQIGINNGYASLNDGFPPLNFTPIAAGGVPPFGQDMNGIQLQITKSLRWQQAGGGWYYDADFATAIGGYAKNAILMSAVVAGNQFMNTVDGNTSDPDAGGAGWVVAPGTLGTGACMWSPFTDVPTGWVPMQTLYRIGKAGAGAQYNGADALPLYTKIYNNFSNAQCPVSSGRGANAAADFAAGKIIQVPSLSGTGIMGLDNSNGFLNGVPVVSGGINIAGSIVGGNLVTLTLAQIAQHAHNYNGTTSGMNANISHIHSAATSPVFVPTTAGSSGVTVWGVSGGGTNIGVGVDPATIDHGHPYSGVTDGQGSSAAHNNVEQSMLGKFLLKL